MLYEHGLESALNAFGVPKTASALTTLGVLAGGGLGMAADPEHSWQAAAMGGLAGGGLGYGASRAVSGLKGLKVPKVTAAPTPAASPAATPAAAARTPGLSAEAIADIGAMARAQAQRMRAHRQHVNASAPVPNASVSELKRGAPRIPRVKESSFEPSINSNGGVGLTFKTPQGVRLPGMHRWVPHEAIEDVYRQLDMGTDPEDVKAPSHPGIAALGGGVVGGLFGLGVGPGLGGAGVGAGLGAAAGLGLHKLTQGERERDTREALKGVLAERRNEQHSARESMPLTVPTNSGV